MTPAILVGGIAVCLLAGLVALFFVASSAGYVVSLIAQPFVQLIQQSTLLDITFHNRLAAALRVHLHVHFGDESLVDRQVVFGQTVQFVQPGNVSTRERVNLLHVIFTGPVVAQAVVKAGNLRP